MPGRRVLRSRSRRRRRGGVAEHPTFRATRRRLRYGTETGAIVLRGGREEAQEAAARRLLRSEAALARDALDRGPWCRREAGERLQPEAAPLPAPVSAGRLGIVAAEAALTHSGFGRQG